MVARVVVLGGGAAGYFGAIRAAELGADVTLLEATHSPMQKIRISGGGRCNVTHNLFEPAQLVTRYPRGAKELRGVLSRWGPRETIHWFESRGVKLKAEADGRVFPESDDSQTIIDCLSAAAEKAGVKVRLGETIIDAKPGFELRLKSGEVLHADALLLATGSNPGGLALARGLGHTLVPGVPSLFTFEVNDPRLDDLSGVSVPRVRATLRFMDGKKIEQEGPLLITHWGLSAHAVLRLSAWGAREMHEAGYRATLVIDLAPDMNEEELKRRIEAARNYSPLEKVSEPLVDLPRRLWERVIEHAGAQGNVKWCDVPNRGVQALLDNVKRATFQVRGKGPFKEEFVTAGGVTRTEVDWRTMESKIVPGLHFAGEILDVDALTGGFNFQNAWSTGYLAGDAMAKRA